MHILSPETDNCPSWISGRERMTVENISWSISTKECCRPQQGLNPWPPGLQSDSASNWAMGRHYIKKKLSCLSCRQHVYWSSSSFLPNITKTCLIRVSVMERTIKDVSMDFCFWGGNYITKWELSLLHLTLPFGPPVHPYQILSKLSQTVWELWPAQDIGFRGR